MPIALTGTGLIIIKNIAEAIGVLVLPRQCPQRGFDQWLDGAFVSRPVPEFRENDGIKTRSSGGAIVARARVVIEQRQRSGVRFMQHASWLLIPPVIFDL